MFSIKSNEEIGANLKTLILNKYNSVRGFCKEYLRINGSDLKDSAEIRNICNRFSQILNGSKSLQTYDLPIVSELLGVSCEDILSCGETRVPLNFRRTNYNIAFSDNKSDWEEYLSREDCIAAYADEFGKTVLDYAIEFKNYGFIRFLIDKGYITLVTQDAGWDAFPNFGAKSEIKERSHYQATLDQELFENRLLRTQILSLAIERNDIDALDRFVAKVIPSQLTLSLFNPDLDCTQYLDKEFIRTIVESSSKVFDYFFQKYKTLEIGGKREITWIYPFAGKLIEEAIKAKKNNKALKALDVVIEHNKTAFEELKKAYLAAAKTLKDTYYSKSSYATVLDMVKRDFHISKQNNFVCLNVFGIPTLQPVYFNIIAVDCQSDDSQLQSKVDELNRIYKRILDIPNQIVKTAKGGE